MVLPSKSYAHIRATDSSVLVQVIIFGGMPKGIFAGLVAAKPSFWYDEGKKS